MEILYDLIFLFFSFLYLPFFILKRKYHREFTQRLGILPPDLPSRIKNKKIIWMHAVSVGEVNAALPLWKAMRERFPQYRVIFSTITKTGNNLAQKFARPDELVVYFPLDFSFIVRKVIKIIQPHLVIILETELWPNFVSQCKKNGIPIFLVNARISDNSFGRYRLVRPFLKPVLEKINFILAQTDKDARRLVGLGADENKVKVTGNMKFDSTDYTNKKNADYADCRLRLWLKSGEKLFIAGSTHPGEEEIILSVYKELLTQFPDLRLLIAPRHPERTPQIEKIIVQNNFIPLRISCLEHQSTRAPEHQAPVFILDTIGQLRDFYAVSDIVFVGGSLIKKGGHNIIEPAIFSKPIISGRHYFNFTDIFKLFLEKEAVLISQNKEDLKQKIKCLLGNQALAFDLGRRAQELVNRNRGAVSKNLELIKSLLH